MKKCNECLIEKTIDSFGINRETKDGFNRKCKDCINKKRRKRISIHDFPKPMNGYKYCLICSKEKTIDKFIKDSSKKEGVRNTCKECNNLKKRKTPIMPIPREGYKYCASCKVEKPIGDYNIRKRSFDKKYLPFSYCKECERKKDSERYEHKCGMCGIEYKSGRKNNKICVECHRELMKQDKVMYKFKKRDFAGEKNPMFGIQRFGEKNPNFNPDLTEEDRYTGRLVEGYGVWRKEVYIRDDYTCKCCGKKGNGDLVAHHLDGYSWCKEKRTDIDNGVTLCNECHNDFHKIYGNRKNTKEQYLEYTFKKSIGK